MIELDEIVFAAREQLTELPESVTLSRQSLRAMVPASIALWQNEINANPARRHNFLQRSPNIRIASGVADISQVVETMGYRLDFIHESDIEIAYSKQPVLHVRFVNSKNRLYLGSRQDRFYVLAYLTGTKITFRDPDAAANVDATATMNGQFTMRSVVLPTDLSKMPRSVLPDLAVALADLARQQLREQNRGVNIAPK